MAIAAALLFSSFATALKAPWELPLAPVDPSHGEAISISRLQMSGGAQDLAPLRVTPHVIPLTRRKAKSRSSIVAQAIREQAMAAAGDSRLSNGSAPFIQAADGTIFLVPVTIGGQDFDVVLDTGSSDPWIITPGFQCVDLYSGDLEDEDYCYFGPVYDSTQSSTYVPIADENINLSYADGEFMTGSMGYEIFSMGGITVPSQQFGLVNYAGWLGDGVSSGLIGFAYSTITSAYAGTDPTQDQPHHTLQYNTLFTNMWNESLVAPVFSLALDRDPNSGGVLALGGIPNIPHTPYWVSTPIQSVGVLPGTNTLAYEYYTVESDGFAVSGEPNAQFGPVGGSNPAKTPLMEPGAVVVDSGTSVLYAPNTVADAFAAAFDPPATIDNDSGMYDCDCMGTPPVFGVSIGEKVFYVNPVDLIVQTGEDTCISGVQPNNGGLTILGDVWMKNVIAVHDIGAEMMRFAAREYDTLTPNGVPATT